MRRAVRCAALLACLTPCSAGAQSLSLTEQEALARLAPDSPRVRAIRAAIDITRVDVLSAGRWPNPRVTFIRESVVGVTETMWTVSQTLPISGRRSLEIQAASSLVAASSSRADEETRRLRADLRLTFAQLAAAEAREQQLTMARSRLRQLVGVLDKRVAAGDAAGFDRLRAAHEVLDVDAEIRTAAADRARAQAVLASFFTAVDPSQIVTVPRRAPVATLPSLDDLVKRAEASRGGLQALRNEMEAARFAERAAERSRIPDPEVVAGTKSSNFSGGGVGSVIAVHASLPLFDRARPERALALARASQAEAQLEAARIVIRSEVAALYGEVLARREAADRYRAEAVADADQIERIAQVSYEAGERSILELLDAYRVGSSARVRQTTLDAAVRQAEIELEFTSGWEIP